MNRFLSLLAAGAVLCLAGCSSNGDDAPEAVATGPKAYVGLFGQDAVAVVDTESRKVLKNIAVPKGPHGLVITPDGAKVYVSSDGATSVSVISTTTDTIMGSIEVGQTPHGLSISPDGSLVLLSDFGGDRAEAIDTNTDQVTWSLDIAAPHNSAISTDGKTAFVGSQKAGAPAIAVVALGNGTETASVSLQKAPRALDFGVGGKVYFTVMGESALEWLDPADDTLGVPIETGGSPHHMLATKDGEYELVVAQSTGNLEFVEPEAGKVTASVHTGTTPHWIALSDDGTMAYVTNEGDGTLSFVSLADKSVSDAIMVGAAPRKVAVQPRKL